MNQDKLYNQLKFSFPKSFQLWKYISENGLDKSEVDWSSGEMADALQQFTLDGYRSQFRFVPSLNRSYSKLPTFPKLVFYIFHRLNVIYNKSETSSVYIVLLEEEAKRFNLHQDDLYSYISSQTKDEFFLLCLEEWLYRRSNSNKIYRTLHSSLENGDSVLENLGRVEIIIKKVPPRIVKIPQRKRGYTDQGSLGSDQPTVAEIESESYQLIEKARKQEDFNKWARVSGFIGLSSYLAEEIVGE